MKTLKYLIGLIALGTMLLSSCRKDDEPSLTAQQEAAMLLNGSWGNAQVISAPVLGAAGTLGNLVITFNISQDLQPSTFSATGAPEYFPSGSTWTWTDATSAAALLLDESLPVTELTLEELTATNLRIRFSFDEPIGGRVKGIGEYIVSFAKQ